MLDFLRSCPQYIANGLANGCIYILVAMGLNIIFNSTGIINFAQGQFCMFGALFVYTFSTSLGLPVPLAIALALAATALIGGITERSMIYPLRNAGVLPAIIATVGVSIFFTGVGRIFWPRESYSSPSYATGSISLFGRVTLDNKFLWILGLTAASVVLLYFFFTHTRAGKAMRACSINRQAASLMGINVSRMSLYAFVIAAALGGLAGLANAEIRYTVGTSLGLAGFTAAVVGGLGNTFGAVAGGLGLGLLEGLLTGFFAVVLHISTGYVEAVTPVILVAVLLLRPQGLLGKGLAEKI